MNWKFQSTHHFRVLNKQFINLFMLKLWVGQRLFSTPWISLQPLQTKRTSGPGPAFIIKPRVKAALCSAYENKPKVFFFKIHRSKRSRDSSRLFPTMAFFNHRKVKTSFVTYFFLAEFLRADLAECFLGNFRASLPLLIRNSHPRKDKRRQAPGLDPDQMFGRSWP